jgi:hypothetical protein
MVGSRSTFGWLGFIEALDIVIASVVVQAIGFKDS